MWQDWSDPGPQGWWSGRDHRPLGYLAWLVGSVMWQDWSDPGPQGWWSGRDHRPLGILGLTAQAVSLIGPAKNQLRPAKSQFLLAKSHFNPQRHQDMKVRPKPSPLRIVNWTLCLCQRLGPKHTASLPKTWIWFLYHAASLPKTRISERLRSRIFAKDSDLGSLSKTPTWYLCQRVESSIFAKRNSHLVSLPKNQILGD